MTKETGTAPTSSQRPTHVRWLVFALAGLTSWMLYLHRYSWGVIKQDVGREFGFSEVQLGWLDSAFSFTYAACQVPGGLAGDILGPALVLTVIIALWSLMVGAMVLGRGFWSLVGIRVLYGAAQSGAYPNLGKVTKSWFPFSIRTTVQGFVASFAGRLGGACAPLIISTLLMGWCGLSWRTTLLAGMGIAFAVVFRLLFRNTPAEHPWSNEAERQLIERNEAPSSPTAKATYSRSVVAWVSFAFLLLHIFTSAFADQLYVNWVPMFLLEEKQLTRESMGVFASLPLLGGALGGMFAGVLNDWLTRVFGGPKWARRIVGVSGKLISAVLVILALGIEGGREMMLVIAVAKFFTDWSQPTVWGAVTDVGGPAAGSVFGAVNMAGSIGGFAAGPILGWIIQTAGWNALFQTIAAIYLVSGFAWLMIDTSRPLVILRQTGDSHS